MPPIIYYGQYRNYIYIVEEKSTYIYIPQIKKIINNSQLAHIICYNL